MLSDLRLNLLFCSSIQNLYSESAAQTPSGASPALDYDASAEVSCCGKKVLNTHRGGGEERIIEHSQASHFHGLSWRYALEDAQWNQPRTDFIAVIIGGLTMTL